MVNKFVRERVLKCKDDKVPVKCGVTNTCANSKITGKPNNKQQTVNKCFRNFDPKDLGKLGFGRNSGIETQPVTPNKFFCLPFFHSQDESGPDASPQKFEDTAEFLFVV